MNRKRDTKSSMNREAKNCIIKLIKNRLCIELKF